MNESQDRVVIRNADMIRILLLVVAGAMTIAPGPSASGAHSFVDLTPRSPGPNRAASDALERRTREDEQARARHRAQTGNPALDTGALERLQVLIGAPPSFWGRFRYPHSADVARAAELRAAAVLIDDLTGRLSSTALELQAGLAQVERWSVPKNGDASARLEHERVALRARVGVTTEQLTVIASGLRDVRGGFAARALAYARQLAGRDPATRLAALRERHRSWGVATNASLIGSELTYTSPSAPAAPQPLPTSTISPAYESAGSSLAALEDLSAESEVELSEDVVSRAAALGSPMAIYEFVKNQCRYEWYFGSLKGSTETLRDCAGNDADLASLLIALLRARGVPARYVHGTVELALLEVASLAGVWRAEASEGDAAELARVREVALRVVGASGVPFEPVVSGGTVTGLRVSHVWVEAFIGYSDYRGSGSGQGARSWVAMDPGVAGQARVVAHAAGIDAVAELGMDLDSFTDAYIQDATSASPLGLLRARIESVIASNHPGSTYQDARRRVERRPETLGMIPGSLPYPVMQVHGEYSELPDELRQRGRIRVSDSTGELLDVTLPLYRLVAHRAALTYSPATESDVGLLAESGSVYTAPATLIQLTPSVRVDGRDAAVGSRPIGLGAPLTWTLGLMLPDGSTRTVANQTVAGNVVALGFGAPRNHHADGPLFLEGDLDAHWTRFLYGRASSYATEWSNAEDELADLLQVVLVRPTVNVVFVESQVEVAEVLGVRQRLVFKGVEVDADLRNVIPVELVPGRKRAFLRISGLEGSHREAQVLAEGCGVAAISASGVLREAVRQGVPILHISAANAALELPRLTTTSEVLEDVRDQLARGREVSIPARDLTMEDWTGSGYVVADPSTGEGGYFLSGRVSGGRTIVSPWRWATDALLEWVRNPYGRPPTNDPDKVTGLSKVVETDLQGVRVGSLGSLPLKVFVYGQWKEASAGKDKTFSGPVVGAKVDFYRCDGDATDARHPVCGTSDVSARAAFDASASEMQTLLSGTAAEVTTRVQSGSRRIAQAVSDSSGFATVWVTPDPVIENCAVREPAPRGTVSQLYGFNRIMAVVWVTRGPPNQPREYPIILRDPFIVIGEPDAAAAVEGPVSLTRVTAGIEVGGGLDAKVVDRFGNPLANEILRWTNDEADGRFVLPAPMGQNIGTTDGLTLRTLDVTGTDATQVPSLEVTTLTQLPVNVAFIAGYGPGTNYFTRVTAKTLGGLSHSYSLYVVQERYAFALGSRRDMWFGGIRGTHLAWPLAASVYRRSANGWSPVTSGVVIEQKSWPESRPGEEVGTSATLSPSGTALLLPTYDYVDDWQHFRWIATVTEPDGSVVQCDTEYGMRAWSGVVKVSLELVDRFSATVALPDPERQWALPTDQRLDVRITNPTERTIFVRAVQPKKPVLKWDDGDAAGPELRSVAANSIGGWEKYVNGDEVAAIEAEVISTGQGGVVSFSVLAPDWADAVTPVLRTLTEDSVSFVGTSTVTFAGPLRCTYYIAEHEFGCVETVSGLDAVAIATVADVVSGDGGDKNAPACAYANGKGPIPPGVYRIAEGIMGRNTGPLSFLLEPAPATRTSPGTETCGRSGLMIHGGTRSEGCIVVKDTAVLESLNGLGTGTLVVKTCRDPGTCAAPSCGYTPGCCRPNGCPPDDTVSYVGSDDTNTCHAIPSTCE